MRSFNFDGFTKWDRRYGPGQVKPLQNRQKNHILQPTMQKITEYLMDQNWTGHWLLWTPSESIQVFIFHVPRWQKKTKSFCVCLVAEQNYLTGRSVIESRGAWHSSLILCPPRLLINRNCILERSVCRNIFFRSSLSTWFCEKRFPCGFSDRFSDTCDSMRNIEKWSQSSLAFTKICE